MSTYGDKEYFRKGYILDLPQQDSVLDFWEGKGGIHVKLCQANKSICVFLPADIWEEMCNLKYNLHPLPLEDIDKVQKAMDKVKEEDDAGEQYEAP